MPRNIQEAWSADTVIKVGAGLVVTAGTIETTTSISAKTGTTYAIADGDRGKLLTFANAGAIAVSLPQAGAGGLFVAGWSVSVLTTGAGTVTITPATSTINGAATLARTTGKGAQIISDGTNYIAQLNG